MANYIETKITYDKVGNNGVAKPTTETYLVDALSFTEAEAKITTMRSPYVQGEFNVSALKKVKIAEVLFNHTAERYYKVKVAFKNLNERTGEYKETFSNSLAQADDLMDAIRMVRDTLKSSITDWEIKACAETPILEVYAYNPPEQKND